MSEPDDGECAPIIVADGGVRCEHCDDVFDGDDAPTTPLPSTVLYLCPACGRWTEEGRRQ